MESLWDVAQTAQGISCNSKCIKPGYIFAAIQGQISDGNQYALEAEHNGACAIVTDSPHNLPKVNIPVYCVPNTRTALPKLAALCYHYPAKKLQLIGVTGSNGKTTITIMLEKIFQAANYKSGLIGTIKVSTGSMTLPSSLTTPDAASLQYYLSLMVESGVTHAAMEVSAQGLELHRVDYVDFACGIITNVCPDHLDFHQTFENYLKAKELFISHIDPNRPLIFNKNDPFCRLLYAKREGIKAYAAINQSADISAYIQSLSPNSSNFTIITHNTFLFGKNLVLDINLPLPGIHNIENALHAAGAALLIGVHPQAIKQALTNFNPVTRRMEVFQQQGITVVDDTALNPGSLNAVFETVKSFPRNHTIVINAIRGKRGPAINAANAAILAKHMPFTLVVTSSADCTDTQDTVTEMEKQAFLQILNKHKVNYIYYPTLKAAIQSAWERLNPGDLLLLLGAQGMDSGHQLLLNHFTFS